MKFKCPKCQRIYAAEQFEADYTIECPGCGKSLRIPKQKTAAATASIQSLPSTTESKQVSGAIESDRLPPRRSYSRWYLLAAGGIVLFLAGIYFGNPVARKQIKSAIAGVVKSTFTGDVEIESAEYSNTFDAAGNNSLFRITMKLHNKTFDVVDYIKLHTRAIRDGRPSPDFETSQPEVVRGGISPGESIESSHLVLARKLHSSDGMSHELPTGSHLEISVDGKNWFSPTPVGKDKQWAENNENITNQLLGNPNGQMFAPQMRMGPANVLNDQDLSTFIEDFKKQDSGNFNAPETEAPQ